MKNICIIFQSKAWKLHKITCIFIEFLFFLHFDFLANFPLRKFSKNKNFRAKITKFWMNKIFDQIFSKFADFLAFENAYFSRFYITNICIFKAWKVCKFVRNWTKNTVHLKLWCFGFRILLFFDIFLIMKISQKIEMKKKIA